MNRGLAWRPLTAVMRAVTDVDLWVPVLLPAVIIMLAWRRIPPPLLPFGRRLSGALRTRSAMVVLALALATGGADFVANHLKDLVGRVRPCKDPEVAALVEARWEVHGRRSFPSSHAANSAAMATTAALFYPGAALPAAALAFLVGFSRIYLGVHYPIDVGAGWLLGMLSGGVWYMALKRFAVPRESWAFTRRFRRASRQSFKPQRVAGVSAEWERLPMESLDGLAGNGWLLRAGSRLAVVVHGLGAGLEAAAVPGAELARRGYSVLLCPLRGHDNVSSRPTSGGPEEAYDLLGALCAGTDEGYPPGRTLLYGSSMGAGVCLKAAAITGETYMGVVLHAVVPDFRSAAASRLGSLQAGLLMRMIPTPRRRGLDAWDPVMYAGLMDGQTPVAALCGSRDALSTPQDAESACSHAGRSMVAVLGGARHPNWLSEGIDMYQYRAALEQVLGFIDSEDAVTRIYIDENGEVRNLPSSHRRMGAQT
ncbi:MAG: phosphatase PAP2 family protein [Candidatus Fermentibacteraceae bacterium]